MPSTAYTPAWWLPGAHAPTFWGKFARRVPLAPVHIERWNTPDDDFIDIVRLDAPADHPRLLLLHGLEGTTRSHYVRGLFAEAAQRAWGADLLLFRTCGGEMNQARRFYHSGETSDFSLVVERIAAEFPGAPLLLAGVSLGGNVLLKWLGEQGARATIRVVAAAGVSVPYDLARSSRHINRGFSRVYERHFLRSLRRKALAKLERYPELATRDAIETAHTMWDFDDVLTARVHGFADAADYYARSSAIGWIDKIRTPTLLLSAFDDPFLPREVLAEVERIAAANPFLEPEFLPRGGHAGFVSGRNPFRPFYYAEWRVADFLAQQLSGQFEEGLATANSRVGAGARRRPARLR